jgi:E3 ubiquitin-protein ligase NEDD4
VYRCFHGLLTPQQEKDQDYRFVQERYFVPKHSQRRGLVVAADGLSKREVFRLPDPFAVITVDAEQTHTTSVIKKTLNPYWNESFDMYVVIHRISRILTIS